VAFLKQYHIDFIDQVVVDPAYRLTAGEILTTQIPLRAEDNQITRSMTAPAVFSLARGIELTGGVGATAPDGLVIQRTDLFLRSSHESWASGDAKAVTTGITQYQDARDVKGPVAVGVELDYAKGADSRLPISRMTRLIAFGDTAFASNQFLEMLGNRDLILNAVNELAGDQVLIASRERLNQNQRAAFFISDEQARGAFVLGSVIEPAIMFGIGLLVFVRRRFFI
jgi:hypothetical protein